jgi:hypothetical protein
MLASRISPSGTIETAPATAVSTEERNGSFRSQSAYPSAAPSGTMTATRIRRSWLSEFSSGERGCLNSRASPASRSA